MAPNTNETPVPDIIQSSYWRWSKGRGVHIPLDVFASIYRCGALDTLHTTGQLSPQLEAVRELAEFCQRPDSEVDHHRCLRTIGALEAQLREQRAEGG